MTYSGSRLGTSTCLMKCQSHRSEGWQKGRQRKSGRRKESIRRRGTEGCHVNVSDRRRGERRRGWKKKIYTEQNVPLTSLTGGPQTVDGGGVEWKGRAEVRGERKLPWVRPLTCPMRGGRGCRCTPLCSLPPRCSRTFPAWGHVWTRPWDDIRRNLSNVDADNQLGCKYMYNSLLLVLLPALSVSLSALFHPVVEGGLKIYTYCKS